MQNAPQIGQLCIWDAFGDFSCKHQASASAFAKPASRPDWELFTEPMKAPAVPMVQASSKQKKEGFCGCQAAAVS